MITYKEKLILILRVLGAATSRCYLKKNSYNLLLKGRVVWSYVTSSLVVLSVAHLDL